MTGLSTRLAQLEQRNRADGPPLLAFESEEAYAEALAVAERSGEGQAFLRRKVVFVDLDRV